jgi:hypothetical protein
VRFVNLTTLELTELLPSQRGLIETVSPLASFFGHAAKGRPRRTRVEVLRESKTVGNTMQLDVRVDELLEQGLVRVTGDQQLLTLLATSSPWKEWRAVREAPSQLTALWAGWAPTVVLEALASQVTQVMVSLDTLFVRTARRSFECALPLEPADAQTAPAELRPMLAVHARIAALRIYGGGSNVPSQAFELGWTAQGFTGTSARDVVDRMVTEANAR